MTPPAETFLSAAALLRERASTATRGPWEAEDGENCWKLFGAVTPGLHPMQLIKAPKHGTPYAEYWPNEADAAWITTVHPLIGLALADLIDSFASCECDEDSDHWPQKRAALNLARLLLGETETEGARP